jgi:hypothetical protein
VPARATPDDFSATEPACRLLVAMRTFILASILMAACSAATDPGPAAACDDIQSALCERLYACYTPAELAAVGYPADEAACVTMSEAQSGCTAETAASVCTGNQRYHADEAATCSDQIAGLACSQVRDPGLDIDVDAPACGLVCAVSQ